jgi:hypothetical protein
MEGEVGSGSQDRSPAVSRSGRIEKRPDGVKAIRTCWSGRIL